MEPVVNPRERWGSSTPRQRLISKIILAGIGLVFIFALVEDPPKSSPSDNALDIGKRATVLNSFVGCPVLNDLDKSIHLLQEGDTVAFATYASDHGCRAILPFEETTVEAASQFHGAKCLRRDGEPECRWYPTPFIKPAPAND